MKHTSISEDIVSCSNFFREYCMKKDQVMKYKWIESEKQGADIGLERAWLQWESRYYQTWKSHVNSGYA